MQTDLIGHRIKLQHLKVVIAVAEWGSMAKAARHLAISQPVVSKVIADLEDVLGVRLFDRSPQGVEPTGYGRALLKRGITIFDDLRTSVDEIKFMADPTSGELRLGSTEPLLAGLGIAVMERMWRKYPRINFRIVEADSATLLNRDLPERRIEIALVPLLSSSVNRDLEATILFHDRLRVVAGMKSPWARRRTVELAELVGEAWCLAPSSIGSLMADAFRASGLEMPRIAVTTTTAHLLFQLLESGRFIGHFGDGLLHFYANRFALKKLPIELPIAPFTVAIMTPKNRTISPVAQLFVDTAREVVRPLAKRQSRPAADHAGGKD
jgi:DNA-binding transcriptional LysR family regulator